MNFNWNSIVIFQGEIRNPYIKKRPLLYFQGKWTNLNFLQKSTCWPQKSMMMIYYSEICDSDTEKISGTSFKVNGTIRVFHKNRLVDPHDIMVAIFMVLFIIRTLENSLECFLNTIGYIITRWVRWVRSVHMRWFWCSNSASRGCETLLWI